MTDDDDGGGLCCLGVIALYVIIWAIDEYGWGPVVGVIVIIVAIIAAIYVCYNIWEEAYSDLDKGEAFIKFGIAWFILIFFISAIIDLSFIPYYDISYDIRSFIWVFSVLLNLIGTYSLLEHGARRLKSATDVFSYTVRRLAKDIINFGHFWFIFWLISSIIIAINTPYPGVVFSVLLIFVISGTFIIRELGNNLSKVNEERRVIHGHPLVSLIIRTMLENAVNREELETYKSIFSTERFKSFPVDDINDVPEHAVCLYCQGNIRESFRNFGGVVKCSKCGAFYHKDCFKQYGCGSLICKFRKN